MPEVVGIICEYDPFHTGHARQFALIRERLPGASIICIMSGCFTQRGMPALYAPAFRANVALRAGADFVLELPALFAVREAERFALGGVSVLHQLGFVTHISFGCESDDLSLLWETADVLEAQDPHFSLLLKAHLKGGKSFAAAQGLALREMMAAGKVFRPGLQDLVSTPNNILAICYLRALLRLGSSIQPLPVLRVGAYHAKELNAPGFPSATAIRAAILRGELSQAEAACGYALPGLPLFMDATLAGQANTRFAPTPASPLCLPDALDSVLLAQLRQMDKEAILLLPDCAEGLENLLYRVCREAVSRDELIDALKSKRYTHARLSRLLAHALLGIMRDLQEAVPLPTYVRLLGFRKESESLLGGLRSSSVNVVSKAANGPLADPAWQLDARAYDLWALGAKIPAGFIMRQPVEVV